MNTRFLKVLELLSQPAGRLGRTTRFFSYLLLLRGSASQKLLPVKEPAVSPPPGVCPTALWDRGRGCGTVASQDTAVCVQGSAHSSGNAASPCGLHCICTKLCSN